MPKTKKSTKLFQKRHLKHTLEQRKEGKAMKQKIVDRKKQRARRRDDGEDAGHPEAADSHLLQAPKPIEEMDVDEFMAEGFRDLLEGGGDDHEDGSDGGDTLDDEEDADESAMVDEEEGEDGDALDDDEDDEDDEGVEAEDAELSALEAATADTSDELARHRQQLAKLKAKDPEFYAFLEQNDKGLLDFSRDDDEGEDGGDGEEEEEDDGDEEHDGDEAEEEEEEEEEEGAEAEEDGEDGDGEAAAPEDDDEDDGQKRELTMDQVRKWRAMIRGKKSMRALRQALHGFTEACHASDEEKEVSTKYRINSAAVFNAVIKLCLEHAPFVFDAALQVSPDKPVTQLLSNNKRWKTVRTSVKVFISNVLALLPSLADAEMSAFAMAQAGHAARYFVCFPRLAKRLMHHCLEVWSTSPNEDARMHAFIAVRSLAILQPSPFLEIGLKGVYLAYVRACRFRTPADVPLLQLMENCVVELYRLDKQESYQHAFVYIRQLAIHLRTAITTKKKESFAQVYNWQFLASVRMWARVLGEGSDQAQKATLQPLIFPLVQITIALVRLIPTARYFPLRFQCIQILLQLSEKTGVFIPLASLILHPLDSHEMKRKPRPSMDKAFMLQNMIRVSKAKLDTKQFQDATFDAVYDCVIRHFAQHATSIAFPEIAVTTLAKLRRLLKSTKNQHFQKQLKTLVLKLQENSDFIARARANVSFSPKDSTEVARWSRKMATEGNAPLQRFAKLWLASEQRRLSAEAAAAAQAAAAAGSRKRSKGGDDDDEDDDDGSNGSEVDSSEEADEPPRKKAKTAAAADTGMAGKLSASKQTPPQKQQQQQGKKKQQQQQQGGDQHSDSEESFTGALQNDDVGVFRMEEFENEDD